MRWFPVLMIFLLASTAVAATGLGVPNILKSAQTIDASVSNTIYADVLLTGNLNKTDVTFFAEVNGTGLNVNGKNPRYSTDLTLKNYSKEVISIAIKGLKNGTYLLTWGFIEHSSSSGVPIDSRVDRTTVIVVKNAEVVVSTNTSSVTSNPSSGGGRGGGGGGGVILHTPSPSPSPTPSSFPPINPPIIQDMSGEGNIAIGSVPPNIVQKNDLVTTLSDVPVVKPRLKVALENTKMVAVLAIFGLSLLAGVSAFYAVSKAKRGERS